MRNRTRADVAGPGDASRSTLRFRDFPTCSRSASAALKQRAFGLRGLAQKGDPLACEIFDFQARVLGLHVATLAMAVDPAFVVIGGGLMDPEATTEPFRERYLRIVREAADPYLWPAQRERLSVVPAALGDLSQAIGAGLVALYQSRS